MSYYGSQMVVENYNVMGVAKAARESAGGDSTVSGSRVGERGLDWFTFFLADVQTGFGAFVAVYLASQGWTHANIGILLTIGGLAALAGQMPGGALIDVTRSYRLFATLALATIAASSLAVALWPSIPVVMASRVLHAGASCVLGPAVAAISLDLVGHAAMAERLGRNARFASTGNCLTAAALGASAGYSCQVGRCCSSRRRSFCRASPCWRRFT